MANVSRPNGASPVFNGNGSPWNQQARTYWIPSTDGSQYNIGDFVKSSAGNDTATQRAKIVKATAGATVRGIVVGFLPDPNALQIINVPATKLHDYFALVVDDPSIIFEMTDDGVDTTKLSATSAVGKNANFVVANPTAPSPVSATVIDSATIATTNSLPIKIIGLSQIPGNAAGAFARWLCKFNLHELSVSGTTGV